MMLNEPHRVNAVLCVQLYTTSTGTAIQYCQEVSRLLRSRRERPDDDDYACERGVITHHNITITTPTYYIIDRTNPRLVLRYVRLTVEHAAGILWLRSNIILTVQ